MEMFALSSLMINQVFIDPKIPTYIDLILTNKQNLLKLSAHFETGLLNIFRSNNKFNEVR